MGQPLPVTDDTRGMEEVVNAEEQEVGDERHRYPVRDGHLLDRYMPEDFRQKEGHLKRQDSH